MKPNQPDRATEVADGQPAPSPGDGAMKPDLIERANAMLGSLCDPECEGRCSECPETLVREMRDAIASLLAPGEMETTAEERAGILVKLKADMRDGYDVGGSWAPKILRDLARETARANQERARAEAAERALNRGIAEAERKVRIYTPEGWTNPPLPIDAACLKTAEDILMALKGTTP